MSFNFHTHGVMIGALLLCVLAGGCATQIVPPAHPQSPVTIYATDYGRHSTIVLPARGGTYDEYAFGDWEFLALGHSDFSVGIMALLNSRESTLGWRHVGPVKSDAELKEALGCQRLLPVVVSRQRVDALAQQIAARFRQSPYVPIYSSYSLMYHVPDREHYSGFNNCNHSTARWLEQLGCDIRGSAMTSAFEVWRAPAEPGTQLGMARDR